MAYRKKGRVLTFYVFYDKNDFVRYFGTAYDLVKQGIFKDENTVRENAYHQNKNRPAFADAKYMPTDSDKSIGLAGGISYKELMESVENDR